MQQGADINGAAHRSRGYAIDIHDLLHFALELTHASTFRTLVKLNRDNKKLQPTAASNKRFSLFDFLGF